MQTTVMIVIHLSWHIGYFSISFYLRSLPGTGTPQTLLRLATCRGCMPLHVPGAFLSQTTPATESLKGHIQVLEEYHRKASRQAGPAERSSVLVNQVQAGFKGVFERVEADGSGLFETPRCGHGGVSAYSESPIVEACSTFSWNL